MRSAANILGYYCPGYPPGFHSFFTKVDQDQIEALGPETDISTLFRLMIEKFRGLLRRRHKPALKPTLIQMVGKGTLTVTLENVRFPYN